MKEKDFNVMLNNNKDMPKIVKITDKNSIERWGGESMIIAPPLYYDELMKQVKKGEVTTTNELRKVIAKNNNADFTDPMTAGIFVNIVALASNQRKDNLTPYHRTLRSDGALNPKFPGGMEEQKRLLESEGHTIIKKGIKNIIYYCEDFMNKLHKF